MVSPYDGQMIRLLQDILGAFAKLRKATISFVMSVRPSARLSLHMSNSAPTGRIFIKFGICSPEISVNSY